MIRSPWRGRSGDTGAWRTDCTGSWTSLSARTTAGCGTAPPPATSPCCARSRSTWAPRTAAAGPAYAAGARRPPGTTTTCSSSSSATLMREPWGLSAFILDMREAEGLTIRPVRTMLNHATTEVFLDRVAVPAANLIGQEGQGFRYLLDGMNAERILIAAECLGDARWFIAKATAYARDRTVFGRPIGQNQGVQFPIARAFAATESAALMAAEAARRFDAGQPCGPQANMAKLLAADASWQAADMCLQTHGGFGFATEYDVERKFRETRLYQVAPVSTNLILAYLAEHVLGLPRSY